MESHHPLFPLFCTLAAICVVLMYCCLLFVPTMSGTILFILFGLCGIACGTAAGNLDSISTSSRTGRHHTLRPA